MPRMNAMAYADFLENSLPGLLEDIPLNIRRNMLFRQDGATPHFALRVRAILNRQLPNRWIGRGGPIQWPARSPDLNVLDFYLWGYVKELLYLHELPGPARAIELVQRIFETIRRRDASRAVNNLRSRAEACIRANGGYFEQNLNHANRDENDFNQIREDFIR